MAQKKRNYVGDSSIIAKKISAVEKILNNGEVFRLTMITGANANQL